MSSSQQREKEIQKKLIFRPLMHLEKELQINNNTIHALLFTTIKGSN